MLQGSIKLSNETEELKGEQLVTIVANALFDLPQGNADDKNLEANIRGAVNILPSLLTGLDVNIKFSGLVYVFSVYRVYLYKIYAVPT